MKIALFGGTFNPPHYGHLILAETARSEFGLDEVVFIPSGQPPHKSSIDSSKEHRFNMVKTAIKGNSSFSISDYEVKKKRITYTYDTIMYFKKKYSRCELYFLLGLDLLLEIHTWKNNRMLFNLCRFIVGIRPKYSVRKIPPGLRSRVEIFRIPQIDIASRNLREKIRQGKSIKYLVPEAVEKYIYENGLYSAKRRVCA